VAGALRRVDDMRFRLLHATEQGAANGELGQATANLASGFRTALADDLNVSAALAAVFDFVRQVNTAIDAGKVGSGDRERVKAALADADQVLGVLDPDAWATGDVAAEARNEEIDSLVQARDEARRKRDFAAADRLRQELVDRGVVLEDTPQGTRWKYR